VRPSRRFMGEARAAVAKPKVMMDKNNMIRMCWVKGRFEDLEESSRSARPFICRRHTSLHLQCVRERIGVNN
jgi:hypothetical protein